jgi:hypothetical protein
MANETERATGTHSLENADGGTSQNGKRNRASDGHSRPGEYRWRDKSKWEKRLSERQALTSWGAQTEGQVRMRKETGRTTGTHGLVSADGGTSPNGKINRASNGHSDWRAQTE